MAERIQADGENAVLVDVDPAGRLFLSIVDEHVNSTRSARIGKVELVDLVAAITVRARAAVTAGYLIGVHRIHKGDV